MAIIEEIDSMGRMGTKLSSLTGLALVTELASFIQRQSMLAGSLGDNEDTEDHAEFAKRFADVLRMALEIAVIKAMGHEPEVPADGWEAHLGLTRTEYLEQCSSEMLKKAIERLGAS
jgi:hypothetical protein